MMDHIWNGDRTDYGTNIIDQLIWIRVTKGSYPQRLWLNGWTLRLRFHRNCPSSANRHDAHVDPLSGLLNRRGFDDAVCPLPTVNYGGPEDAGTDGTLHQGQRASPATVRSRAA